LLQKGFTPEILNSFRPRIEQIVDRLLDKVAPNGQMDVIADLSYQLPVQVVGMMLGVPEKDHLRFMHWMDQIAMLMGSAKASVDDGRQAKEAFEGLTAYFKELLPQRRAQPGRDLISILLAAEEEGDVLSEHELYANCVFFLFAGHETTSNLIGNGFYCLFQYPDQLALLRQNPALMPGLIEETLRYQAPFQFTFRMARHDFDLYGQPVRKGQIVVFPFGASNRDPEVFERPDEFDLTREKNPHLTFSYGLHHCIGANTARLEASVAFSRLLARFENIEPLFDTENPEWHPVYRFRGLRTLPIRFLPQRAQS
jgi:pimeloyl-[acyl-carrier protein] synthase